jgi:hypothetical protein
MSRLSGMSRLKRESAARDVQAGPQEINSHTQQVA